MKLSNDQYKFLKDEFGISESDISSLSNDCIRELRERCFDIEVEEATMADNENMEITARGEMAAELVDAMLTYFKTASRIAV